MNECVRVCVREGKSESECERRPFEAVRKIPQNERRSFSVFLLIFFSVWFGLCVLSALRCRQHFLCVAFAGRFVNKFCDWLTAAAGWGLGRGLSCLSVCVHVVFCATFSY